MARDFDGTGDSISFGSDASIDNMGAAMSFAFWVQCDDTGTNEGLLVKYSWPNGWFSFQGNGNDFAFGHSWSGAPGVFWDTTTTITGGGSVHIACTYNGSNTANNPTVYLNNTSDTLTENSGPPSGTLDADAAANMTLGTGALIGASDFNGRVQNLEFSNAVWDAAQINRHRWYGRVGGATLLRHPFLTTKLTNEGTATANGTATNTTVVSLPRTERMYCASMGCGR